MTYCVAVKLNAGLVVPVRFAHQTPGWTHQHLSQMIVYEKADDRFMVLLSAGNLSISQSVREILQVEQVKDREGADPITIWNARSMFDAARVLGSAIRRVYERDAEALKNADVDFTSRWSSAARSAARRLRLFQDVFGRQLHRGDQRDAVFPGR